jgi:arsenical pump membrane protein
LALLLGTNLGPVLVLSGSLSGLLWRDPALRLGVEVTASRYSAVGLRVGLPALLASSGLFLWF